MVLALYIGQLAQVEQRRIVRWHDPVGLDKIGASLVRILCRPKSHAKIRVVP
jgi:hypothetical protein